MSIVRSILCPVDFSDLSRQVLRCAMALAVRHRSRLTVVTAVDPLLAEAARTRLQIDLVAADTTPALRAFVEAAWPGAPSDVRRATVDACVGDAHEVILAAADRAQADVIVMGTRGIGGVRKWLLGSTADRVLHRTRTAVLAIPPDAAASVLLDGGAPRFEVGRILMATDFEPGSAAAFDRATAFVREYGVPLLLAHVVEPLSAPAQWRAEVADVDRERQESARRRLESLLQLLDGIGGEAVVTLGHPADAIAAVAADRGVGLIVLGLTGREDGGGARPGSIAYRLLCLSQVPVLVVPPARTG